MTEKSAKQFIAEMKEAFGDGIHSIQVLDANGVLVKQTDNWIDEDVFLAAERVRFLEAQKIERAGNGKNYWNTNK